MTFTLDNDYGYDEEPACFERQLQAAPVIEEAAYQLGLCYLHGNGVALDEDKALTWFYHAAIHGHKEAQSLLESMKKIEIVRYNTYYKIIQLVPIGKFPLVT